MGAAQATASTIKFLKLFKISVSEILLKSLILYINPPYSLYNSQHLLNEILTTLFTEKA